MVCCNWILAFVRYDEFCNFLPIWQILQLPPDTTNSVTSSRYDEFCNFLPVQLILQLLPIRRILQLPPDMTNSATSSRYDKFCNKPLLHSHSTCNSFASIQRLYSILLPVLIFLPICMILSNFQPIDHISFSRNVLLLPR